MRKINVSRAAFFGLMFAAWALSASWLIAWLHVGSVEKSAEGILRGLPRYTWSQSHGVEIFGGRSNVKREPIVAIEAKNRDHLVGLLMGAAVVRDQGRHVPVDYVAIGQVYGFGNEPCEAKFKTYEDIPRHSLACPDFADGREGWIIYYEDDVLWNWWVRLTKRVQRNIAKMRRAAEIKREYAAAMMELEASK